MLLLAPVLFATILQLAYGSSGFQCVGLGSSITSIQTTLDGVNWIASATNYGTPIFDVQGYNAAYSIQHDMWIAVGQGTYQVAYNFGGIDAQWYHHNASVFDTGSGRGVVYGKAVDTWVIVGNGATAAMYYGYPDSALNGSVTTWLSNTTGDVFATHAYDVSYSDISNIFVAVGVSGVNGYVASRSPDGINWYRIGPTDYRVSDQAVAISWNNEVLMWIGSRNGSSFHAITTPDGLGIIQISQSTIVDGPLFDVEYANGKWLATGDPLNDDQIIETSIDGLNWVRVASSFPPVNGFGTGISFSADLGLWISTGILMYPSYSYDAVNWFNATSATKLFNAAHCRSAYALLPLSLTGITVVETSIIKTNESSIVNGTLEVTDSLYVNGRLTLVGNTSSVLVNKTLSLGNESSLAITIGYFVPAGSVVTILPATYSVLNGQFRSVVATVNSPCPAAIYTNYGSMTLTVAIQIDSCLTGVGSDNSTTLAPAAASSNVGIIVGIAVGCVVLAVAVILLIVFLTKKRQRSNDLANNKQLANKETELMKDRIANQAATSKPCVGVLL